MPSIQSLLYAAASAITIVQVRALVRQGGAESPTIEYEEQMTDTIARGVAGLGNTYLGLLLVGVSDGRVVRGVKVKTIESVSDHCAAKIVPPWAPQIVPASQGQDRTRICTPWSCVAPRRAAMIREGHHAKPIQKDH